MLGPLLRFPLPSSVVDKSLCAIMVQKGRSGPGLVAP